MNEQPPQDDAAPDLRTMEELCQPTMHGRGGLIAPLNIAANDFGLKHHMIQQVQNLCQFHGLLDDNANKHLDKFLTVTQRINENKGQYALKPFCFLSSSLPRIMLPFHQHKLTPIQHTLF